MQIQGDISTDGYYPEYTAGDEEEDAIRANVAAFQKGFANPDQVPAAKAAIPSFLAFIVVGSAVLVWFGKR